MTLFHSSPHESAPSLNIARLTYLLVCEAAGVAIALSTKGTEFEISMTFGVLAGLGVAAFFILVESLIKSFTLRRFSTATFGLGVGLLCAWLLTRVEISNLLELSFRDRLADEGRADVLVEALRLAVDVTLFASLNHYFVSPFLIGLSLPFLVEKLFWMLEFVGGSIRKWKTRLRGDEGGWWRCVGTVRVSSAEADFCRTLHQIEVLDAVLTLFEDSQHVAEGVA